MYNGIAGAAIHAESGICVHAGGQLPCGGRFGGGAGAAKVQQPDGGQRAEQRTMQKTTKSPNSALPPCRWQRRRRSGPRSAARPPGRDQPSVRKRRACDTAEAQLEHGPVLQPHPALGGLTGKPGVERGRNAETQLSIAVPAVVGGRAVMMCDVGHIVVNDVR